jgi:hypothetical protein
MKRRLLAGWLLACAGCSPWILRPCLEGDALRTKFVREGWREANDPALSYQKRICATEGVLSRCEAEDDEDAPACTEEILDELTVALVEGRPVANDRLQLARLVGISRAHQTGPHMAAKARAVIEVAAIEEDEIADYRLLPGESGPPPDRRLFRRLALRALADTHLTLNRPEVRAAAIARRRAAREAIDRRILQYMTVQHLEDTLWGHPDRAVDNGSFTLFDQILDETRAALARPYEEVEHGLLLDNLGVLAFHARRFGREAPAARVIRSVLDHEGRVPSVRGQPAARRDLYVAAALAEIVCHADHREVSPYFTLWYEQPPRPVDALLFTPALYERGFDCRGKDEATLYLDKLLAALDTAPPLPEGALSKDQVRLLRLIPARPREVAARPALRALLLAHPGALQDRSRSVWYDSDPLVPLALALTGSQPGDARAQAFLRGILDAARRSVGGWGLSREILLAARYAKAFGMDADLRALADELETKARNETDPSGPSFSSLATAGIRASVAASAFEIW